MIATYKFRLYPTKTQTELMDETLETCRRLYNRLLSDRIENRTGFYDQKKKLVQLKSDNKFLKDVHSQVLQDVPLRLDKTFQSYFAGLSRFPRFKRRGKYNSFTYPQHNIGFKMSINFLKLGKIGKVKTRLHRAIIGTIKQATIIKDIDQWFVAFSVECQPTQQKHEGTAVGVDTGIGNLIALSSGETIPNPKFLKQSVERIKHLQKELSRKKKGSKNREKAKITLAKAWRKVRRQRDDFIHKLSFKLANENNVIVFEDLKVKNMVKNHTLASAILDSTWGKLRQLTAYKVEKRGGRVVLVDPSGTSQKCSRCGWISPTKLELKDRVFHCADCGLVIDRDINAARNILQSGLEQSHVETEPLLVKRISKFQSRKREARELNSRVVHGVLVSSKASHLDCLEGYSAMRRFSKP